MTNIIKALEWRYATKKFDSAKKIPDKEMEELLEVLRLAPSSFGLQPWKFVLVKNQELQKKLREAAWNQAQVTDASHFIVLCARTDVNEKYVKHFIETIAKIRNVSSESLKGYQNMAFESISGMTKEQLLDWNKRQVYLALGMLLEAAALKEIDTCPMGGFVPEKIDEILELKRENATAAVLCALGYRASDDALAKAAKVRFPKEETIIKK